MSRPEAFRLVSDMTHMERRAIMDRGEFWNFHTWEGEDGEAVEYWRAVEGFAGAIRFLRDGEMQSIRVFDYAGAALAILRNIGCCVPGIPA